MLEEQYLGTPAMITALPIEDALGRVLPADSKSWSNSSPEAMRARARVFASGCVAELLAGAASKPEASRKDLRELVRMAVRSKRFERFTSEALAGAEFQLRLHWGAVLGVSELLQRLGILTEPHGLELARATLRENPMRQLVPDLDTFSRLLGEIQRVPELAEPLERALREMQPPAPPAKARQAKPTRRTYTRSSASYLHPVPGIDRRAKARA
jgi:hypothetical protein